MLKQFKNGGVVIIDKSHKSLYHTPISCMEYFNSFSLMVSLLWSEIEIINTSSKRVVCFLFPKLIINNYVDITLETC